MTRHGAFVDLRLNQQEAQGNESFWPSFTDVMTVIMMIFLISMVVVLLRNMELVKEIRATMEAERQAVELARATGMEKENLAAQLESALEQLHDNEEINQELQMQVLRLQEQNQVRADALKDRNRQLAALQQERDSLATQLETLRADTQAATELRQRLEQQLADSQQQQSRLQQELEAQQAEHQALLARLQDEQNKVQAARKQAQEIEDKYLVLADEFDNLKVRYDKLVRPARSAKGRHLVEVRYYKKNGKYHIEWRDQGRGEFQAVSRKTLESRLSRLKQQNPSGLYIKVILPKNNGLTYSEAWKFTNHLHRSYDYYFQDTVEPAADEE